MSARAPPLVEVDPGSTTPAYRQVADALRAHLVSGELKPGDRLPTVRRLALDLGLNHNTVAHAYRLLAAEGWVELVQGRGAQVRKRNGAEAKASSQTALKERTRFARRVRELAAQALSAGLPVEAIRHELQRLAEPPALPLTSAKRRTT